MAVPKFSGELGRVPSFSKSINRHHHIKDDAEIDHLTEYDSFSVNRDQVMDLEIWLKIHTKVSNCETASSKVILTLKIFMISMILFKIGKHSDFHLSFFQIVGA